MLVTEEEKEGVQGLEGPSRYVVEGRGRLDKQWGVFLQSHGMGIHGVPQMLILETLKGLLDRVDVLDGHFGQVICLCGHGLHVQDGPFGQAFCPCGHGLHVPGDGGDHALVDVLDGGGMYAYRIYSLSLTERGVALDELSSGNN